MAVIDASALALAPEEATSASEIINERTWNDPELSEISAIYTGIQRKAQIVFAVQMGLVGKTSAGCDPEEDDVNIAFTQKYWDPVEIDFKIPHCKDDLPSLFKAFQRKMKANESYDLEGEEEMLFIIDRSETAQKLANLRISWFSDTAIDNVANGGVLTNGVAIKYFNPIDGHWKQIYAGVTANEINRVTINENGGANYNAQLTLGATAAYDYLKSLYNTSDERLKTDENTYIALTPELYDNYAEMIEDKSLNFSTEYVQKKNGMLAFRGVPLKRISFWGRFIKQYFDNGVTWDKPHRAVMTVAENVPVATMDEESMKEFNSWYNKDNRKNYVEGIWTIDAKVLEPYMIAVAY